MTKSQKSQKKLPDKQLDASVFPLATLDGKNGVDNGLTGYSQTNFYDDDESPRPKSIHLILRPENNELTEIFFRLYLMGTRPHVHCRFFGGKSEENHLLRLKFVKVFKIQPQIGVLPHRIKINSF